MHDIAGHIKNIFTELPNVLNENEKKVFNDIYQITICSKQCKRACDYRLVLLDIVLITICSKQCKRACDYRLVLLDIVLIMKDILQPAILEFLLTLVEIQRIFYAQSSKQHPNKF